MLILELNATRGNSAASQGFHIFNSINAVGYIMSVYSSIL